MERLGASIPMARKILIRPWVDETDNHSKHLIKCLELMPSNSAVALSGSSHGTLFVGCGVRVKWVS